MVRVITELLLLLLSNNWAAQVLGKMISTVIEKLFSHYKYWTSFTVPAMWSFSVHLLVYIELQFMEVFVVTSLKYSSLNYVLESK